MKNDITIFEIMHIDPLGQGVSKLNPNKVIFVQKTLPGEKGKCDIKIDKSKVAFGKLTELDIESPERIQPQCLHYSDCPSCQFLHTHYSFEVQSKLQSLQFLLKKIDFPIESVEVIDADQRLGYRNRIQLHYSKKSKKLGYFNSLLNQIIEVPMCLIGDTAIQSHLKKLYENQTWLKMIEEQGAPDLGNIVVLNKIDFSHAIKLNSAHTGGEEFTQVNLAQNQKLKKVISEIIGDNSQNILWDLFGGKGNLSQNLSFKEKYIFDVYPHSSELEESKFINLNLFDKKNLKQLLKYPLPQWIIVDPPRSGWLELAEVVTEFPTKNYLYVSCSPQTLIRDLATLKDKIKIHKIILMDLFPSTYHFETVVYFTKI